MLVKFEKSQEYNPDIFRKYTKEFQTQDLGKHQRFV